ncbi:648_t:CDS:2, partial [Dentiscutata erythropus]
MKILIKRCRDNVGNPIDAISASVSPDPVIPGQNVTFKVSGTLNNAITDKEQIYILYFDKGHYLDIKNSTAPQTEAGSSFNANPTFETPVDLPNKYFIQVKVANPRDPTDPKKENTIGCITAS